MAYHGKKGAVNFFNMLRDQAAVTVDGVKALLAYCDDPSTENGDKVIEFEHLADDKRRLLISEINKTFITPIEREDLFALSGAIDDIVDYARTAVEELRVYNILPDEHLKKMCSLLLNIATNLLNATSHLENNRDIAADDAIKVKKLENTTNEIYHAALSDLFESDDFKHVFKYREIYRHMNRASDKGDNAADILLGILMKL